MSPTKCIALIAISLLGLALWLAAAGPTRPEEFSYSNYLRLREGMDVKQVEKIIGPWNDTLAVDIETFKPVGHPSLRKGTFEAHWLNVPGPNWTRSIVVCITDGRVTSARYCLRAMP